MLSISAAISGSFFEGGFCCAKLEFLIVVWITSYASTIDTWWLVISIHSWENNNPWLYQKHCDYGKKHYWINVSYATTDYFNTAFIKYFIYLMVFRIMLWTEFQKKFFNDLCVRHFKPYYFPLSFHFIIAIIIIVPIIIIVIIMVIMVNVILVTLRLLLWLLSLLLLLL